MSEKETIAPVSQYHIAAQTGAAFTVEKNRIIRIEIYPMGEKELD